MGYVDFSDRMLNSYSISKNTWKWTKKLLFHLLDLTILNSYILYKSCGRNMTHLKFREQLVRDLIVLSHEKNTEIRGVPRSQPSSSETQMSQLEVKYSLAGQRKRAMLSVCQMEKQSEKTVYYCEKCDCGLCVAPCFRLWYTKTQL
jgi:hypothetical protein